MFRVKVKVKPDARREAFIETKPHEFSISVREPAQGNAANARIRLIIAEHYQVPVSKARFVTGMRGTGKTLEVLE